MMFDVSVGYSLIAFFFFFPFSLFPLVQIEIIYNYGREDND